MKDARVCAEIAHKHGRTFALASRLLPTEKRRGMFALYAVCRTADDMVDRAVPGSPVDTLRQDLADFSGGIRRALAGSPSTAIERELAWTASRFTVPSASIDELLAGIALDLVPHRYDTWSELQRYCASVASSVGEMCVSVFGVSSRETTGEAVRSARTLGLAMQLTNIVRDVGEDARRGRCYLPEDDLAVHGFTQDDVLNGSCLRRHQGWREAMRTQIERAHSLYRDALPGIALLVADAQPCATACALGYSRILDAIERNDYNNLTRRAHVAWGDRARILFDAWRGREGENAGDIDVAVA